MTLPDGGTVTSDDTRFADLMSAALGRPVTLASSAPSEPTLEEYWPDMAELDHQETVTDEGMPAGTFFDLATIHVLTTATINQLRALYPEGRFEVRRFRPNIVVRPDAGDAEFVESKWVGRELRVGDDLVLEITDHSILIQQGCAALAAGSDQIARDRRRSSAAAPCVRRAPAASRPLDP